MVYHTWKLFIDENLNLIMKIDTITIFHLKNRVPQEYLLDIIYENKKVYFNFCDKEKEYDTLIIQSMLQIK